MAQVTKKENLTISIREYMDNQGQTKKVWKTIGELITWDDGKQSFEMWGPGGVVKGSVFEQQERSVVEPAQNTGYANPQQAPQQQAPQQQHAPQQQQPSYNNRP